MGSNSHTNIYIYIYIYIYLYVVLTFKANIFLNSIKWLMFMIQVRFLRGVGEEGTD